MLKPTYLFYDIETTGCHPAFDQILHFAAIRTDLNLREEARYDIKIKLNKDVIPSPAAMMTHRMRLHDIQNGASEYLAIQQIHQVMNTPGTISLGYNTLKFDDEFLRFSFYRNLLSPYTHQYANQCYRMDLYPMVVMYYLFKPHTLEWPSIEEKVSLKLELLNQANQLWEGRAHNAMVDVEVTLALAKKLKQEEKMWAYLSGFYNKSEEQQRLAKLDQDRCLMVWGPLGYVQQFLSQVICLGTHWHYTNQQLWLRLDHVPFGDLTKEQLISSAYVIRKRFGEPGFILPLEERFATRLGTTRLALADANYQWLMDHPEMLAYLQAHFLVERYPHYPETDHAAKLYMDGFWMPEEERWCQQFHAALGAHKAQLTAEIQQSRLYPFALRILGRHFPDDLTEIQRYDFQYYLESIDPKPPQVPLIDYKGQPRLTPDGAFQEIAALRLASHLDDEQHQLLNELEAELRHRFS